MAGSSTPKSKKALVVTAPLVQVQVGERVLQFGCGDVLPEDGVSAEALKHLKELEYVTEGEPVSDADQNDA